MSASRRGACGRFVLPRGDVGASPLSPAEAAVRAARGGSSSGPVCCPIAHQPTVLRESRSARRPSRSQLRNAGTSLCTRAGPLPRRPAPRRLTPPRRAGSSLYSFLASSTGSKTGPETGLGRENGRRRGQVREGAGPAVPRTRSDSGPCWPSLQPGPGRGPGRVPASQGHPGDRLGEMPTAGRAPPATRKSNPAQQAAGAATPHGAAPRSCCVCPFVCVCVCVCTDRPAVCGHVASSGVPKNESPSEAS